MSYSPPPGAYRIDVGDETAAAYRIVLDNYRLVIELALLPALIVLAAEFVALILPGGIIARVLGALIQAAALLIFGTVFPVRWHRFVLLGESVAGGLFPPGWSEFLIASIKLGVLIVAGWIVLGVVAVLPPHILTLPLTFAGGIALTLAAMRVALIFPAAAVERPVGLTTAWGWIAGNFWRLFVCLVVCYLPFAVAGYVVISIGAVFPGPFWIVFAALRLAVSFAGAAVVAALLSHIYRGLGSAPSAGT